MKVTCLSILASMSAFGYGQTITVTSSLHLTQTFITNNTNKTANNTQPWTMQFTGIDSSQFIILSATIQLSATGTWVDHVLGLGPSSATGADTASANSTLFSPALSESVSTAESYLNTWSIGSFGDLTVTKHASDLSPIVSISSSELPSLYGSTVSLTGKTVFGASHTQFSGMFNTTSNHALTEDLLGKLTIVVKPVPEPESIMGLCLGIASILSLRKRKR